MELAKKIYIYIYFGQKDEQLFGWAYNLPRGYFSYFAKLLIKAYLNNEEIKWLEGDESIPQITRFNKKITIDVVKEKELYDFFSQIEYYQRSNVVKNLLIEYKQKDISVSKKPKPVKKENPKKKAEIVFVDTTNKKKSSIVNKEKTITKDESYYRDLLLNFSEEYDK